jgi:Protein of unknown function (DUF1592)/Protein of unknown function (DUF1588)/Protein of unknown function (DUF1587)/Protein of unknown function (DUF1585)/Protein of unknown function (DUF1595)/Planctomycete cytochrome C
MTRKRLTAIAAMVTTSVLPTAASPFFEQHCIECHDAETKKGGLDLTALGTKLDAPSKLATWVKIHDRVRDGEMPPAEQERPAGADVAAFLGPLAGELRAADAARQRRDGRGALRRMSRVEFENALRDLLGLPGLALLADLPADGMAAGFDHAAEALDFSFVHMETYLAAVDKALNEATPAFREQPPVFKYRYRPWDNNRHDGKEAEGSVVQSVADGNYVPLIGLERDPTFEAVETWFMKDDEPHATAFGLYRHEDADFKLTLTAISPVLTGLHKVRVSAYSFAWDGRNVMPTERTGALALSMHSTNQHFGTKGVPANKAGVAEFTAHLQRSEGQIHGTDNHLRIILSSCENVRDFGHRTPHKGPPHPCPGLAIEWVEIEGPFHEQWPPVSQHALFGDLPVGLWRKDGGSPKPTQQVWPRGAHGTFPDDIYGEEGTKRVDVEVVSMEPDTDARRLLESFLRRAFRRPAESADVEHYARIFSTRLAAGDHFQDALKSAYRAALVSPDFLLMGFRREAFALAEKLSALLWSSLPDAPLLALAQSGELAKPDVLLAQSERLLNDPKAARFTADFTGQWLRLREVEANAPDKELYPEFMPWLQESMLLETRAFFAELLRCDLSITHLVKSDFAMLNEPLARHYGIEGVSGFDIRRVSLSPDSPRGGFITQGALLKVTANGTTTSPVTRGAFVMERILGIHPTPPPPDIGSIEPDTRGTTTIREQLDKHKRNVSCASCHVKMDPYGFALESFDVVGQWREKYRARGGAGDDKQRPVFNGHRIAYHYERPVDCSGLLPDGRAFKDITELRNMLAANDETLARAFLGQLITYATGASVSFADRTEVDKIIQRTKATHFGVRALLLETIASPLFSKPSTVQ